MSEYFSTIFAKSPVRPLQEHMGKVQECIEFLLPFFEAVFEEDFEAATEIHEQISIAEAQADYFKKELRLHLPRGMFMAVSRGDILNVLTMQDNIANKAKTIASLVINRGMKIPKPLQSVYKKLIGKSIKASFQAQIAIGELEELIEVGFRGGEVKLVKKLLNKLDKIESDTDELGTRLYSMLYHMEKDLNPVDAVFLYKLIDYTGNLGDIAQRVGSRLQVMLAR